MLNFDILEDGYPLELLYRLFKGRTLQLQPGGLWLTGGKPAPPLPGQRSCRPSSEAVWPPCTLVVRRPEEKFNRPGCVKMCEQPAAQGRKVVCLISEKFCRTESPNGITQGHDLT